MKTTDYFISEVSDLMVQAIIYRNIIIFGIIAVVMFFFYSRAQRIAKKHVPKGGVWSKDAYRIDFEFPDDFKCSFLWFFAIILFFVLLLGSWSAFIKIKNKSLLTYKIENGIIWKSFNNNSFEEIEYDYIIYIKSREKTSKEGVVDLRLLKLEGEEELELYSFNLSLRFQENPEEVKQEILKRIPKERFLSKFMLE